MFGNVFPIHLAVAAGALRAAFDDVSGDGAGGELVPVVRFPFELVDHRRERERGIGGTAGDHDIGARVERFRQRERPDVGIGRKDAISNGRDGLAGVHIPHLVTFAEEFVDSIENIVARARRRP